MKVYFTKDYEELSQMAYDILVQTIKSNDHPVISLNTGGTPRGLFKKIVDGISNGLNIQNTTLFTLDEYVGPKNAIYSVQTYMKNNLIELIPEHFNNVYLINGDASNQEEEIKRYTDLLDKNPRDIQMLGLGTNGHVGANEPGTPFDSTMFVAKHTKSTIQSTMREYGIPLEETPKRMFTLGFSEIMAAKKIVLIVSGKHKAEAVKNLLEGEISTDCPVSYLKNHENFIVIIDEAAASLLTLEDK